MEVKLLNNTPVPESLIEVAYISCRTVAGGIGEQQEKKSFEERIEQIFSLGHLGVLEHASATFLITGISRSCTHQLVRHRMASYCQLSMRAVEPTRVGYVIPDTYPPWAKAEYSELRHNMLDLYHRMVLAGVPLEDARFVCPIGTETQIVVTMNFRAWIHFLKLRTARSAQWEIRAVADNILFSLQRIAPNVFNEKWRDYWE